MDRDRHWFHIVSFARVGSTLMEAGIPPADVFRRCGIAPMMFLDPDCLVPRGVALRLVNEMGRMQNDRAKRLALVMRQQFSGYGAPGQLAEAGPTLADSLAATVRAFRLYQSGTCVTVRDMGRRVHVDVTSEGWSAEDPSLHLELATTWLYRTVCLAGTPSSVEARIAGPRPPRASDYEPVFGSRLAFGGDRYEVVFDRELLDLPVARESSQSATEEPQNLMTDPVEGGRAVHLAILRALPRGRPTVDRIADNFAMSTRSLQRTLQRWGVPFETIVDDTRRQQALDLLAQGERSAMEIAFLLGYADQPQFIRAFRRWTGTTPGAYRKFHRPLLAAE